MKDILNKIMQSLDFKHAVRSLKKLEYSLNTPESRFAIPFVYRSRGFYKIITPLQTPSEFELLYREIIKIKPKSTLEIGTAQGGTLYLWCQACASNAKIVSVDLPGGKFGGGYSNERAKLYQAFARDKQELHLLRENSHTESTQEKVKNIFIGENIDYLFIDGDHTYEGVKNDFLAYGKMVRPGGLIVLHDVMPAIHNPEIEVNRLWEQIKKCFSTKEYCFEDRKGRKLGLGLISVPEEGFPTINEFN